MNRKLALLTKLQEEEIDCAVLTSKEEIVPLCGYAGNSDCFILTASGASFLITAEKPSVDSFNNDFSDITVLLYESCGFQTIEQGVVNKAALLSGILQNRQRIAVGKNALFPLFGKNITDISGFLESLFLIKTPAEAKAVQRTLALNHAAFDAVRRNAHTGMTELDIYDLVSSAYHRKAGQVISFLGDFLTGRRTSLIAGSPSGKTLQEGDAVILDLLPELNGYCCDTSRTFFLGEATFSQKKVYACVDQALFLGESILRPGVSSSAVYEQISHFILQCGYPALPHHAGHGVGFSRYEAPFFIPPCAAPLEEGMIVTLEPGIYIEDKFGVRLENNYLITADGCLNLSPYPDNLDSFII